MTTFRLAMRERGDWWIAFVAEPHTMDGAFEIGRISMAVVRSDRKIKDAFLDLMRRSIESAFPEVKTWNEPTTAPNSEREQ